MLELAQTTSTFYRGTTDSLFMHTLWEVILLWKSLTVGVVFSSSSWKTFLFSFHTLAWIIIDDKIALDFFLVGNHKYIVLYLD